MNRPAVRRIGIVLLAALAWVATDPGQARAERAWVRGEVRLNVRTGPSNEYRIITTLKTGDAVDLMRRGEGWTMVRLADGKQGWIPGGYLMPTPPPLVRVQQLEDEVQELRANLSTVSEEASTLRASNAEIHTQDAARQAELDRLTRENMDLRAGARWPYLITGASILGFGMLVGAALSRSSARRSTRRIKL